MERSIENLEHSMAGRAFPPPLRKITNLSDMRWAGQFDDKACSGILDVADLDTAAVQFYDGFGDGQSEAGASTGQSHQIP